MVIIILNSLPKILHQPFKNMYSMKKQDIKLSTLGNECVWLCVMITLSFMQGGLGLNEKAQKPTGHWGTCCCLEESFGAIGMLLCKVAIIGIEGRMKVHEGWSDPSSRCIILEDQLQLWILKEK